MRLGQWRREAGLTLAEVGAMIGVSAEAARRYEADARVPDRRRMRAIHLATGGKVSANDVYRLGPIHGRAASEIPAAVVSRGPRGPARHTKRSS